MHKLYKKKNNSSERIFVNCITCEVFMIKRYFKKSLCCSMKSYILGNAKRRHSATLSFVRNRNLCVRRYMNTCIYNSPQ